MFESLEIRNFRCFESLRIERLERVNLIDGMNNVGKTSALEAIHLFSGKFPVYPGLRRGGEEAHGPLERRFEYERTMCAALFHDFEEASPIEIEGRLRDGHRFLAALRMSSEDGNSIDLPGQQQSAVSEGELKKRTGTRSRLEDPSGRRISMVLELWETTPFRSPDAGGAFAVSYVGAREKPSAVLDAERLGMLEVVAEPYDLLVSLRVIDPRITRIRTITVGQIPVIHGDVGLGRMLPLTLLGEGLQRMASLLLAIATTAGGIVLIDEIENGLHHSVLPKVWRAIADAAKRFDVQVFATTHSYECIGAAHAAFEAQSDYDFRLHRLESIKGEVKAISYDRETLGVAMDAYMEVR